MCFEELSVFSEQDNYLMKRELGTEYAQINISTILFLNLHFCSFVETYFTHNGIKSGLFCAVKRTSYEVT